MAVISRTACISAALLAIGGMASSVSAQTPLKDRVAAAVETVERACATDISKFCGTVTPWRGPCPAVHAGARRSIGYQMPIRRCIAPHAISNAR